MMLVFKYLTVSLCWLALSVYPSASQNETEFSSTTTTTTATTTATITATTIRTTRTTSTTLVSETCNSYTYSSSLVMPARVCSGGYCCGTCTNRYCCYDVNQRLDQSACTTKCNSYYNSYGTYFSEQTCDKFCCGTCTSRYCCSSSSFSLDQTNCRTGPTTTRQSTYYYSNSPNAFFWTFGVFMGLLILCAMISCFKYRATQHRMNQRASIAHANRPTSVPRLAYNQPGRQNNYNPYNYEISTIYNTNFQTDLPPPYESIKVEPKDPNKEEDKESSV